MRHIVTDKLEALLSDELADVALVSGKTVIQADHGVPFFDQAVTQMRTKKPCPARNQYRLAHRIPPSTKVQCKSASCADLTYFQCLLRSVQCALFVFQWQIE